MPELKTISEISEIALPDSFHCPICGDRLQIVEVSEWFKDDADNWKAGAVKIDCVTSPDIDDIDEFNGFNSGHWSMPYVDWLPVERRVTAWANERYCWNLG